MSSKKIVLTLSIITLGIIAFFILRSFLFNQIEKQLSERMQGLNSDSLSLTYGSLEVDWKRNAVVLKGLEIETKEKKEDCEHTPSLRITAISVKGIDLLKLIFTERITVEEIYVDTMIFVKQKNTYLFSDSASSDSDIRIDAAFVQIDNLRLEYVDSASCRTLSRLQTGISLTNLKYSREEKAFPIAVESFKVSKPTIIVPPSNYTLKIQEIRAHIPKGILAMDTLTIIPHYDRLTFGRKAGHDVDHISGTVPFIHMAGIKYLYDDSLSLSIKRLETKFWLNIFRDKRLPHLNVYKPLPVELIRKIGFGLNIDTLEIVKSFVKYEEIAADAEEPGLIYFDNLRGKLTTINNDSDLQKGAMKLTASAALMGNAKIEIEAGFPYKANQESKVQGTLRNFDFEKANPMLVPAAHVEVQSGHLTYLTFQFGYSGNRSDGSVEINYHGLKVAQLKEVDDDKKEKKQDEKLQKDNLKTLLINTFVLKKNMDGNMPEEKRTGTVLYSRDKTRSIFNYWWKSVFSGVKSAFNLPDDKDKSKARSR